MRALALLTEYSRRFFTTCIVYGAAFHIWSSFVFVRYDGDTDTSEEPDSDRNIHQQRIEKDYENESRDEDQLGIVDDEDVAFVPLSLPLLRPGDFYAVSDPEWQEFAKISRDTEKLRKLKSVCCFACDVLVSVLTFLGDLVGMVVKNASQSSRLSSILGGQLSVTSYWLMHKFPYRAPPQYSRIGCVCAIVIAIDTFTHKGTD